MLSAVAIAAFAAGTVAAFTPGTGPERVGFPQNYADRFVLYDRVDKPDRRITRFLYIDPEAARAARAGEPLPDGTVIVMEDHPVALQPDGQPTTGPDGRLQPTPQVRSVFVMEKRAGWGATIPSEIRNGDWDYAVFLPDGRPNPQVTNTQPCFACHLPQAAQDFTFTTFEAVRRGLR